MLLPIQDLIALEKLYLEAHPEAHKSYLDIGKYEVWGVETGLIQHYENDGSRSYQRQLRELRHV